MTDWSSDLQIALSSGDPAFMKAMLARVPEAVLQTAVPYLEAIATRNVHEGELDTALTYYDQLIALQPDNRGWRGGRAQTYLKLDRLTEALADAEHLSRLDPAAALGYRLQAQAHDGLRERTRAAAAYRQLLQIEPDDESARARLKILEDEARKEQLLQTLQGKPPEQSTSSAPVLPKLAFDPALLRAPGIPADAASAMVEGLQQHLRRYGAHQSVRNTLDHISDPAWLAAWDRSLAAVQGCSVVLLGSELGTFALRARMLGATQVLALEEHALGARIAGGIVQKNLLMAWHEQHGSTLASWSEAEREASFATFTQAIRIAPRDASDADADLARCDYVIFPNIDHSLLATGMARTIKQLRDRGLNPHAKILPARATVFAVGIEWLYPSSAFELDPLQQLRWSAAPQALHLDSAAWRALTGVQRVGSIDFQDFREEAWQLSMPVTCDGRLDAILYWFELDLGTAQLSSAPDSGVKCLRPAVQYTDGLPLQRGTELPLHVAITHSRLRFDTSPSIEQLRSCSLPSWYVPMLLDRCRNEAYSTAVSKALAETPAASVLDIGAGCGLLSMMAARAGATPVTACELNTAIAGIAREVAALNQLERPIDIVTKDCRELRIPADMPARADIALFELFDCSLIGEGVLHFLSYAREHLLKPDARYLPMAASIYAMVIEYRFDRLWGIDVNLLNPFRFTPSFINVDAAHLDYRPLTAPVEVFAFDFRTATPQPQQTPLTLPAIAAGTAGAVLFWFDLQIDAEVRLSNHPHSASKLHWQQGLQFLPEVGIQPGFVLPLQAKHDGSSLSFGWQPDAVPKELFSTLPRFDPRWWQQASELETQTRSLLEHCRQNPEEYRKVAELAARFAADPAAHGIDPVIAQRFVASFFS